MLAVQESGQQKPNVGSSNNTTMSPIRKAMSLSTIFRQSVDGGGSKQTQSSAKNQSNSPMNASTNTSNIPQSGGYPQLKRMTRRISFRRSPSMSPANGVALPNLAVSSPISCAGTPSSIASSTSGTTPASLSSSTGSTFAQFSSGGSTTNGSSTFRGRPRSGSCRASFFNGNGRILPFTLPAMGGGTEEEDLAMNGETPKGKGVSIHHHGVGERVRSTSFSPSSPPRRPITPAPLLILDEEMNSLGITTGPIATWLTNQSNNTEKDSFDRPSGLGLSAPFSSNFTSDPSKRNSSIPSAMHRLSLCPSQESFHCRGLETSIKSVTEREIEIDPLDTIASASEHRVGHTITAPPMLRSVSETTSTTESNSIRLNKNITPGSPLGWRRRPWALSLQIQPSLQTSKPLLSPTGFTPPHTAVPTLTIQRNKEDDESISDQHQQQSRFSISSEDTGKTSGCEDRNSSSCQQSCEEDVDESPREGEEGRNFFASPQSTWSSSAYSFDTTLESPPVRHSSHFRNGIFESPPIRQSSKTDSEEFARTIRRRSKTVSIIPDKRTSSLEIGSLKSILPKMQVTLTKSTEDIPAICPASPPSRVRLHLTLPPSTVAKGLPQAHTMLMPTTASTLEFKETICKSLQFRHGISISPSQLGLFVVEESDQNRSLSPFQTILPNGISTSPLSRSPNLPSLSSSNSTSCINTNKQSGGGGFLRSRLRSGSNAGLNSPNPTAVTSTSTSTSTISNSTSLNSFIQQQHNKQTSSSNVIKPQAYRQLQNESALYQEGLQDDDSIIVRF